MRTSHNKKEWLVDEAGNLQGLSLGYDHFEEHSEGVTPLHRFFGVNPPTYPVGVQDRQITVCPAMLTFVEYDYRPRDKRRKTYKAASLMLRDDRYDRHNFTHQELLKSFDLDFYTDIDYPEGLPQDELICAWDKDEFGVNVRGAENIARLRRMFEAMQALDVAICRPTVDGFMRSGLSFVIASTVPAAAHAAVTEADLAHKRLHLAAEATGVSELLKNTGSRYIALSPDWADRETEDGIIFFLNPDEQQSFNYGWFTVAELTAWATHRTGPVVKDAKLIEFAHFRKGWEGNLLTGLLAHGLSLRIGARLEWLDAEKTQVAIRIRPAKGCETRLPEGLYPFEETMAKYCKLPETA